MTRSFFSIYLFIVVLLFGAYPVSAIKDFVAPDGSEGEHSKRPHPVSSPKSPLGKELTLSDIESAEEEMDMSVDSSFVSASSGESPPLRIAKRLRAHPSAKRVCHSLSGSEGSLDSEGADGEDESGYVTPDEEARPPMHVVYSPGETGTVRTLGAVVGDLIPPTPPYAKQKRKATTPLRKTEEMRRKRLAERREKRQSRWEKLDACVPAPALSVLQREQLAFAPLIAYIAERKDLVLQRTTDQTPLDRLSVLAQLRRSLLIGGGYFSRVIAWEGRGGNHYVIQADALIDLERLDGHGKRNLARMLTGKAPIGPDGRRVQLHHAVQSDAYEIVEVSHTLHISGVHFKRPAASNPVVYDDPLAARKLDHSVDRGSFASFRAAYWRERAHALQATVHVLERSARISQLFGTDDEGSPLSSASGTCDSELSDDSIVRTPLSQALTLRSESLEEKRGWTVDEAVGALPT